jgi:hypothetical protein
MLYISAGWLLLVAPAPVRTGDLSGPDLPAQVACARSVGEGSVRAIPDWNAIDASPVQIVVGMSKADVLAVLRGDWTGSLSVPNATMQGKDVWEVAQPWRHGQHIISIRFKGGVVDDVSEVWISP